MQAQVSGARLGPAAILTTGQLAPPRPPRPSRRQQAAQRVGTTAAYSTRSASRSGVAGRGYEGQASYDGRSVAQEALEWRTRETPKQNDGSEQQGVRLSRSQIINKSIITRSSGINLGVASQTWIDARNWEVVAVDVRPNLLYGDLDTVLLSNFKQVGDVILVENEEAVERQWSSYGYYTLVACDIYTQSGEYLGKVRDYEFDPETGILTQIFFDALGIPLLPASVVSVYSLGIEDVVSANYERVIVRAGCESRILQLTQSLLQRLELVEPPWEESQRMQEYGGQLQYNGYADWDYAYGPPRDEMERGRAPRGRFGEEAFPGQAQQMQQQQQQQQMQGRRRRARPGQFGEPGGYEYDGESAQWEAARAGRRGGAQAGPPPLPPPSREYLRADRADSFGAEARGEAAAARRAGGGPQQASAPRRDPGGDRAGGGGSVGPARRFDEWVSADPPEPELEYAAGWEPAARQQAAGGRGGGGAGGGGAGRAGDGGWGDPWGPAAGAS